MAVNVLILGLDVSSTAIGYVVRNGAVVDRGVIRLDSKAQIGVRCVAAHDAVATLLDQHAVDLLAIESPVVRFGSCVPQIRVSGAVLELAARRGLLTIEIAPKEAKRVLAGDGDASKQQMLMAAAEAFGFEIEALAYVMRRGDWIAITSGCGVFCEHEADALAVAVAAAGKVEVVA
jgi:Holliday junction resolvasome RuvABC endonuclease subunit